MARVTMFDIQFDNYNFDDLLQFMEAAIQKQEPSYMVTCNVDHLMKLEHDPLFRTVYEHADVVVADGVPIVWASRLLRRRLKMKVSGSDVLQQLGGAIEERQYRLFFLGAAEGVAEAAREKLLQQYPRMQIVGCYSPSYGFESNEQENEHIISILKEAKPHIVLVGVGAPKQEKWIYEHYKRYRAPVSIGVGATFNFLSGSLKRAPKLFQRTGFEWFWRLCQEPTRLWRRYLIEDMRFWGKLLREMIKKRGESNMQPMADSGIKVSLIIPIYNGEKYIAETLTSVINQTHKNIEVFCIIDGTKDSSKQLIEALADPRVTVMEQENHGATWTRNMAVKLATGKYVWFLDQDDNLLPGCIAAAVAEIERTGNMGVAVNGHLIDSNSQIIRRMYRVNKPILSLKKLVKGNQLFTTSQVLLRREAILRNGGFDKDAGIADDWDMWLRIVREDKIDFLDQHLMQYRLHENNHSKNFEKMFRGEMHIVDQKLKDRQNFRAIVSYSYLRYSSRAANWRLLFTALWFNAFLLLTLRFYWTVGQIMLTRLRWNMKKTGGVA